MKFCAFKLTLYSISLNSLSCNSIDSQSENYYLKNIYYTFEIASHFFSSRNSILLFLFSSIRLNKYSISQRLILSSIIKNNCSKLDKNNKL